MQEKERLLKVEIRFPRVEVNYDLPFEDAVAAGGYDEVRQFITKDRFPPQRSGILEVEMLVLLFKCHYKMLGLEQLRKEAAEMNCRLAELRDLLAFGARRFDLQETFMNRGFIENGIVAHGSEWVSNLLGNVPALEHEGNKRILRTVPSLWGPPTGRETRFLVVQNTPQ